MPCSTYSVLFLSLKCSNTVALLHQPPFTYLLLSFKQKSRFILADYAITFFSYIFLNALTILNKLALVTVSGFPPTHSKLFLHKCECIDSLSAIWFSCILALVCGPMEMLLSMVLSLMLLIAYSRRRTYFAYFSCFHYYYYLCYSALNILEELFTCIALKF